MAPLERAPRANLGVRDTGLFLETASLVLGAALARRRSCGAGTWSERSLNHSERNVFRCEDARGILWMAFGDFHFPQVLDDLGLTIQEQGDQLQGEGPWTLATGIPPVKN